MRNIHWRSPLAIAALITAGGTIAAAIITGIFALVITGDSELNSKVFSKVFIVSSQPQPEAEVKFLGDGFANVEGPSTIGVGGSASVALTISLDRLVRAKDVIWRATPAGQPTVKAGPVGTSANLQDAELKDVPIYSEMRARLDAPAFHYLETDWVTKPVSVTATWIWNISPAEGVGPQAVTVFISGPDGAGYEGIVQLEVMIVPVVLEPTHTPIPTPSPTPTTPADTPTPISRCSLFLSVEPLGSGSVTRSKEPGPDGKYKCGEAIQITAHASPSLEFAKWSDGSALSTRTLTVSADIAITAFFSEPTPILATPPPPDTPTPITGNGPPWTAIGALAGVVGVIVAIFFGWRRRVRT